VDFVADLDTFDEVLTLTNDGVLLRVDVSADELLGLEAAPDADWAARRSLAIGRTSLGPVYWCAGETPATVNVLIGPDGELWFLCLVLSEKTVRDILVLARRAAGG
jgi:hypothetical protein